MDSELKEKLLQNDREMLDVFTRRMALEKAAVEKHGDDDFRRRMLDFRSGAAPELADYAGVLYSTLNELGRSCRRRNESLNGTFCKMLRNALQNTGKLFPKNARVACCAQPGAYAQIAADKLFNLADITYVNDFNGVFQAVEKNLCRYGVLPIENSTSGTVDAVCDLMKDHHFYIVRSFRLRVHHVLLVPRGANPAKITEIFSHEQALKQCSKFISGRPGIKCTACASTAQAAKFVAMSGRLDVAAIASRECAEIYDLDIAADHIQNNDFNYTRFICISREPEIYPGANRVSIMAALPHRAGALYQLLGRFSVLGVNLTKLESRPIPGEEFEYMFYFDFDASLNDPAVLELLAELQRDDGKFVFLGNYQEL